MRCYFGVDYKQVGRNERAAFLFAVFSSSKCKDRGLLLIFPLKKRKKIRFGKRKALRVVEELFKRGQINELGCPKFPYREIIS